MKPGPGAWRLIVILLANSHELSLAFTIINQHFPLHDVPLLESSFVVGASKGITSYRDFGVVDGLPSILSSITGPSVELIQGVSVWTSAGYEPSPSNDDVAVLRNAFSEFYRIGRDLNRAIDLFTEAISRWKYQPPDELAGLYRVRGDCYVLIGDAPKAVDDYTLAIQLLDGCGGEKADQAELPSALLGRARSLKSIGRGLSLAEAKSAADDYRRALELLSREEWDSIAERIEDGSSRNPYAAWEWGSVLRLAGDWEQASMAHKLAAATFDSIGDKPHAAISFLDAGIDLAAAGKLGPSNDVVMKALERTSGVQSNNIRLLQSVLEKRGEARMALASILWANGHGSDAETLVRDACVEMEDLLVDMSQGSLSSSEADRIDSSRPLKFSIDDAFPSGSFTCSKFNERVFLAQLSWPESLQTSLQKHLATL